MKVLNPMSGFPAWGYNKGTGNSQGIWPWSPGGFDYRTSTGLGETETPVLEDTNKTLHAPRLRGKEQWLHRKLNQNHLLVLEGLLWRCGSAGTHHRMRELEASAWKVPFGVSPHGSCLNQNIDPKAGSPQDQQIIGLKLYWARPCPSEQDLVFPTTSPSHQAAYTNLLASSIRGQTEEARRTTIPC